MMYANLILCLVAAGTILTQANPIDPQKQTHKYNLYNYM